jgi:hypothetical protein
MDEKLGLAEVAWKDFSFFAWPLFRNRYQRLPVI